MLSQIKPQAPVKILLQGSTSDSAVSPSDRTVSVYDRVTSAKKMGTAEFCNNFIGIKR